MTISRLQKSVLTAETKNLLAILQLSILGVQGLLLIMMMIVASKVGEVASRRPTFAQLLNGQTIYVAEQDRNWRYPDVIRKYVTDWTTLSFNWDDAAGSSEPDQGVKVNDNARVPTNTWFAGVMLESGFADALLPELATLVPEGVFSGQVRQVTITNYVSDPRQIAPGKWEIDVMATRTLMDRETGQTERIPFNRTFTVQAVEIPQSPLGSEASLVEQKIYQIRAAGLEITNITPYTP